MVGSTQLRMKKPSARKTTLGALQGLEPIHDRQLDRQRQQAAHDDLPRVCRDAVGDPEAPHENEENPRRQGDPLDAQAPGALELGQRRCEAEKHRPPAHINGEGVIIHALQVNGAKV
jgi:hypothetical protein